jgi:hypothetical protein
MLLNEFFSKPNEISKKSSEDHGEKIDNDLFWYILDHDKLHKDYFFPIAKKMQKLKECGSEMMLELFMPMVIKGCKEYYQDKKMTGRLSKKFPTEMREGMCKRLYDHYYEDIQKGKYRLG